MTLEVHRHPAHQSKLGPGKLQSRQESTGFRMSLEHDSSFSNSHAEGKVDKPLSQGRFIWGLSATYCILHHTVFSSFMESLCNILRQVLRFPMFRCRKEIPTDLLDVPRTTSCYWGEFPATLLLLGFYIPPTSKTPDCRGSGPNTLLQISLQGPFKFHPSLWCTEYIGTKPFQKQALGWGFYIMKPTRRQNIFWSLQWKEESPHVVKTTQQDWQFTLGDCNARAALHLLGHWEALQAAAHTLGLPSL